MTSGAHAVLDLLLYTLFISGDLRSLSLISGGVLCPKGKEGGGAKHPPY